MKFGNYIIPVAAEKIAITQKKILDSFCFGH